MKLANLNNYYSTGLKRNQLSSLKLSDVITAKNSLRTKIQKELQGIRTSSSDYPELENVNPEDIQKIFKDIKLLLSRTGGNRKKILEIID